MSARIPVPAASGRFPPEVATTRRGRRRGRSSFSFQAEKPRVWADKKFSARPRPPSRDVAIHPDGKRFAFASAQDGGDEKVDQIVIVFNFFDELRRAGKPAN